MPRIPFLDDQARSDDSGTSGLLISLDDPEHARLRKLINRGFTPRRVAQLTERIQARVDSLIDDIAEQGSCDLVTDLALWLPLHVIADLVGVPEEDRAHIFELTEMTFGFDETVTMEKRHEALLAMFSYADGLCEQRRKEPRDDLISVLLAADVDGEQLTQLQIDLFFMLLQNAGSETTRNLITSGTLALLQTSRAARTAASGSRPAARGHRGAAPLRHAGDAVLPDGGDRHRGWRPSHCRRRSGRHVLFVGQSRRAGLLPIPTASTSAASPTTMSPSGPAGPISVWARAWPGSRVASCSTPSSIGWSASR